MVIFSDCKINLGLNVVQKRPDGYHELVTCMMPIPWHDIIEILPSESGNTELITLGNSIACTPDKNLVMRAYLKLKDLYGLPPVKIILQKIVPDGAGLGGGSSDASHTLKALNELFSLGLTNETLAEIACTIGADCPFFIYDEPMIAQGIGEVLSPILLPLDGYTIVIAKPLGVNISTREAYEGIKPKTPEIPLPELLKLSPTEWMGKIKNDFEPHIFALAPQIAQLKEMMLSQGAVYASMSGSGASVYGIFNDDKMAEEVLFKVKDLPHFKYKVNIKNIQ